MSNILWVDPASIRFKIAPVVDLSPIHDGDWDTERRHLIAETVKHRAIAQHFIEGRDWEETDLFRDTYRRRFKQGDSVRGTRSLRELAEQYRTRVDGLHAAMKRDGFQLAGPNGQKYPLPSLLIGRDGEIFIGNQGNHRLAIAQVLGLPQIAGSITCRHAARP